MELQDFTDLGIRCCQPEDIVATGAALTDVRVQTITTLDGFHRLTGLGVVLLENGLTSGSHVSPEHKQGLAVDIAFRVPSSQLCVPHLVGQAYYSGFRGVGVYWNGRALSMHLDVGLRWRQWCKTKWSDGEWRQGALIVDPR